MKSNIYILIIVGIISIPAMIQAQEDNTAFSQLESGILSMQNPFKSQLPKKKAPKYIKPPVKPPEHPRSKQKPIERQKLPKPKLQPKIEQKPLPRVTISGVIWNTDRPQAIINGEIINIGDTVAGIKITNIQKKSISGQFDGRAIVLQP